jgi:5-hydroxyisourate hydrolase
MATASLSTHVLDTGAGRPAPGVAVELSHDGRVIATVQTGDDGRARLADDLAPGRYRLAFAPPSPFFHRVELEIELAEGHYHVPLLVSAYACASYRGS